MESLVDFNNRDKVIAFNLPTNVSGANEHFVEFFDDT